MKVVLCAIAICLTFLFTGQANPFERKNVAADSAWVVHIDFDGLRPTAIGEYLSKEIGKPAARSKWADLESSFGFDLLTNVHGLTAYGSTNFSQAGVWVVYGDFRATRPASSITTNDFQSALYKQTQVYSWRRDKKHRNYVAPVGGRLLICGENELAVRHALDVLDETAPNLLTTRKFLLLGKGDSYFVQGAAQKMDLPLTDPNALLFRMVKEVRLNVAQADGKLAASLRVDADDAASAEQILIVGRGLLGLAKFQRGKPKLAKLAEAILLEQTGANFAATLSLPVSEILESIKASSENKSDHK